MGRLIIALVGLGPNSHTYGTLDTPPHLPRVGDVLAVDRYRLVVH